MTPPEAAAATAPAPQARRRVHEPAACLRLEAAPTPPPPETLWHPSCTRSAVLLAHHTLTAARRPTFRRCPVKRWSPSTILSSAVAGLLLVACSKDARSPVTPPAPLETPPTVTEFERQHPNLHVMLPAGQTRGAVLGSPAADPGIYYHGGPVILAQKVAVIYWASGTIYPGGPAPGSNGAGSADGSLIGFFLNHLGGSPYYNINTTYTDGAGTHIAN